MFVVFIKYYRSSIVTFLQLRFCTVVKTDLPLFLLLFCFILSVPSDSGFLCFEKHFLDGGGGGCGGGRVGRVSLGTVSGGGW